MASTKQLCESLEQYEDVISWINGTLNVFDDSNETVDLVELDHHITQLLTTLDIACEDTSAQLERIIEDVSRGIPRLAYDLHFMKDGALTLQTALADVLLRSKEAVPAETNIALDDLHHLDIIKGHMEASREVLQEAESWSTLEVEVTSLILEKSYAKAAVRLSEASRSMVVFQNTPEYDPRRTLMVNLQNQLEASLSSALVSSINTQDIVACRDYFSIFSVIQRESEFRNYYNASRRSSIVSMWQNALLTDCEPTSPQPPGALPQSFVEFLQKFYTNFALLLNAERAPISSIFPDPAITLSQFITSTLSSLQPTFAQRLSSYNSHHGETSLTFLISLLRATEEFATGVEKVMDKIKSSAASTTQPRFSKIERPATHVRRRSSRLSISWRPDPSRIPPSERGVPTPSGGEVDAMEWDQELFQPFLNAQIDYGSLEQRFLEQSLREIITNDTRERVQDIDRPRLFRERAIDIFGVAEGSMSRCEAFTHGYGVIGLLHALDGFFQSFIDMWTADVRMESSGSSSLVQSSISVGELSDLDYTAQDWSNIQLSLHLLASARAVSERMATFETKLRSYLVEVAAHFRLARTDPHNFVIAVTRGESQLLEQSTLNSAELSTLLANISNDASSPLSAAPHSATLRAQNSAVAGPEVLLASARMSLSTFAQTCQASMQKTILSPLRQHLATYASSPVWGSTGDLKLNNSASDLRVPTFSLSPSDTVQRVAEGLLNLPRLFEVYAYDNALAFSLQTLPNVESELLKTLSEPPPDTPSQSTRRRSSVAFVKPITLDPEMVSSAWLVSLGHTYLDYLTIEVLPSITFLSITGATQLASDLDYLSNIVHALSVEHEALEKWKGYVSMDDEEGKKVLAEERSLDDVLQQVSKIRGWL